MQSNACDDEHSQGRARVVRDIQRKQLTTAGWCAEGCDGSAESARPRQVVTACGMRPCAWVPRLGATECYGVGRA